MSFGGSPKAQPGARSWRQRLLRRASLSNHTQSRASACSHSNPLSLYIFFARKSAEELDGAEGIDVRRHEEINLINLS